MWLRLITSFRLKQRGIMKIGSLHLCIVTTRGIYQIPLTIGFILSLIKSLLTHKLLLCRILMLSSIIINQYLDSFLNIGTVCLLVARILILISSNLNFLSLFRWFRLLLDFLMLLPIVDIILSFHFFKVLGCLFYWYIDWSIQGSLLAKWGLGSSLKSRRLVTSEWALVQKIGRFNSLIGRDPRILRSWTG